MLKIGLDGLFAPCLPDGLRAEQWAAWLPRMAAAHGELMARRASDVGFYDVAADAQLVPAVQREAARLRGLGDDLLVLGIGGSSLGGQALVSALVPQALGFGPSGADTGRSGGGGRVHFVDNVDPDTLARVLDGLVPKRTVVVIITKSGGTVETLAQMLIVRQWLLAGLHGDEAQTNERLLYITDPDRGLLRELANAEGVRTLPVPPTVGGRFSVLTAVGLLPAAFAGVDVAAVMVGAAEMLQQVTAPVSGNGAGVGAANNHGAGDPAGLAAGQPAAALALATMLAQQELGAHTLVFMPYADRLRVLSQWFVQLWAESLGKRVDRSGAVVHSGQTPLVALGATDQHAQLQLFVEGPRDKAVVLVSVEDFDRALPVPALGGDRPELAFLHGHDLSALLAAERRATRAALLDAGVPVIDIGIPRVDSACVGALLLLLEAACAAAGTLMGIEPFDQPGVEAGKRMALGLLGRAGYEQDAARVVAREAVQRSAA